MHLATKTIIVRSPSLRNHIKALPRFQYFFIHSVAELQSEIYGHGLNSFCFDRGSSLIDVTRVHGKILKLGLVNDSILCDQLLDFYLDHGDFNDAAFLFDKMPIRTFHSWNQIITAGLLSCNHFPKCIRYLIKMVQSLPDYHHHRMIMSSVLRSCFQNQISVRYVRHLQGMLIRNGFSHDLVICNPLVDFYAKNGRTDLAWSVFKGSSSLDRTSWVAMISGFSQNKQELDAFRLYSEMRRSAVIPTTYALSSVLSACTKAGLLREATQVHGQAVRLGLSSETYVCNALVSVYSRSGDMKSAEQIFQNKISKVDRITYNSLISGYAQIGAGEPALQVYKAMERSGIRPDCVTTASLLSSCASIVAPIQGLQLHGYTIKAGFSEDVITEGSLLDFYVNCFDKTENARRYFESTKKENVVLWNVMLMAYGRSGDIHEACRIFTDMQVLSVRPNQYTYPSLLRTCTPDAFQLGELIHGLVIKTGFAGNVYVSSTLIDMYAKGGDLPSARKILDGMTEKDVVSWTAMISGYTQHEMFSDAIQTFRKMERNDIRIDNIGLASVLTACAGARDLKRGFEIHGRATVAGYSHDLSIGNALISFYARCGRVSDAQFSFRLIGRIANQVSWNGLISGFAQSGHCEESLNFFVSMVRENSTCDAVGLDLYTYGSAVSAAANIADLKIGKQIHARMTKTSFDLEIEGGNALITLYSKSGSISDAWIQFSLMTIRNEVTWNAMITGYSQHGCGVEALKLFERMKLEENINPNHVTFIGVLSACSHVGLVTQGLDYFASMSNEHQILPRTEHYACVVDILGRAGELSKAQRFITEIPTSIPVDALIYRTLLGACRVHKNTEIGEFVAFRLLEIDPRDSATYVLLSNIYAVTRQWSRRDRIRKLMKENGVRKEPGRSWIEVNNSIHAFFVGDKNHRLSVEIYKYLEELDEKAVKIGYRRDEESFLHEQGCDSKSDWRDFVHSEKLAVVLGVMSREDGMKMIPIRVMKNLRICNDCHSWMICVSKVIERRIVLRDSYRFHHFENGVCSCRNYW